MPDLLAPVHLVDLILMLVLIEATVLLRVHARSGGVIAPGPLMANLAAGTCLLLALRAALGGVGGIWIALALFASLLAHLLDLGLRWRR